MASPQCSNMKPITIKQEAVMTAYKTDCTEKNLRRRQDWQAKYQASKS